MIYFLGGIESNTLKRAQILTELWRRHNKQRPHLSLGYMRLARYVILLVLLIPPYGGGVAAGVLPLNRLDLIKALEHPVEQTAYCRSLSKAILLHFAWTPYSALVRLQGVAHNV